MTKSPIGKRSAFNGLARYFSQSTSYPALLLALLGSAVLACSSLRSQAATTILTLSSNSPWIAPGTGTYNVTVECWGGGGAGGTVEKGGGSTTYAGGGGGGGGAYASSVISVTGGMSYAFSIGTGGITNTSAGNGGNGGNTSFSTNGVAVVVAAGGSGGQGGSPASSTNYPGGLGGANQLPSTGTTIVAGGTGATGNGSSTGYGGGGGGSASSTTTPTTPTGSNGYIGSSTPGGGAGGNGTNGNVNASGLAGSPPGGGGGGGLSHSSSVAGYGGAGAPGQITLTYTVPGVETLYTVLPGQTGVFNGTTTVSGSPNNQTAGTAFVATLYAVTGSLTVDTSYNGNKTITLSGPDAGTFGPAGPVTVNFSSGVGSLTITLSNAVSTVMQCTDGTLPGANSSALTVNAAPASQLLFTTLPQNTAAGTNSLHIYVQRLDPYGNPNTNDPTITLTISSTSTGTYSFNPTPFQILNGFSTNAFTYTDTLAGHPTITVGGSGLTSATQTEIVHAAAASQLLVLMPGETAAPATSNGKSGTALSQRINEPFNIIVNAVDPYWNLQTNQATVVDFSSTDGTPPAQTTLAFGTATVPVTFTAAASASASITASDDADVLTANPGTAVSVIAPQYYKNVTGGNWSSAATWSVSPTLNGTYAGATAPPNNDYVTITTAGVVTNDVAYAAASTVTVNANATLECDAPLNLDASLDVSGTLINSVTNGLTLAAGAAATFENGGTYEHNQNGGVIPAATWAPDSTCAITGWTTGTTFTNGLGQAFGNFTWNNPNETTNVDLDGYLTTVTGNLTIQSTGAGVLYNNASSLNQPSTLTITGDLNLNGGIYGASSYNGGSRKTLWLLGGNLTLAGGVLTNQPNAADASSSTLEFTNLGVASVTMSQSGGAFYWDKIGVVIDAGKTVALGSDFQLLDPYGDPETSASAVKFFTVNGTLNLGNYVLSNPTNSASWGDEIFSNAAGSTLVIGSAAGLDSSGLTGNIQGFNKGTLGAIVLNPAANYVYNGGGGQVTGPGLPGTLTGNLTDASASGSLLLSASEVINASGTLTVNSGATLDLNSQQLTVASAPVLNGGLTMEVNKTAPNTFTGSTLTQTVGTLSYGGTLTVTASGSALAATDTIPLFSAPAYAGGFAAVTAPAPAGYAANYADLQSPASGGAITFAAALYTLMYTAGPGGFISGPTPQSVPYLTSGAPVTAVASNGYAFTSWSDGVTTAMRTDVALIGGTNVTASFVATAPSPTRLTNSISGNQLVLNWPAGQGWILQAQTNALNGRLLTNLSSWFSVTPTPTPPYTNTINKANPSVFYRLYY